MCCKLLICSKLLVGCPHHLDIAAYLYKPLLLRVWFLMLAAVATPLLSCISVKGPGNLTLNPSSYPKLLTSWFIPAGALFLLLSSQIVSGNPTARCKVTGCLIPKLLLHLLLHMLVDRLPACVARYLHPM